MQQPEIAARQFGAAASEYLTSAVHARGEDLADLAARCAARPAGKILDLGCGAGHASYAIAPHAREVIAYDVSAEMLDVVARTARERGLGNIRTQAGAAEALPFAAQELDAVVSRLSAHHWRDVGAALREMHRVLAPGGIAIVIDVAGADDPLCDTHLQAIELLRDCSHVRNYTLAQWRALASAADLACEESSGWRIPIEFDTWIARMRTPPERAAVIRDVWRNAPQEVRRYFQVRPDGSFELDVLRIVMRRAA